MPRERSPDRDKAKEIYIQHEDDIPLTDIADQLNLSEGTIMGWKAKDRWDDELNGTLQSNIKKSMERSKQNTERSEKNKKNYFIKNSPKKPVSKTAENADQKTNSNAPSPFARYGNKNAKGNRGGNGGPDGNQRAVRTHEFESFYYDP